MTTKGAPLIISYKLSVLASGEVLRLDGPTLADIFMGYIYKWNDPVRYSSPSLSLPLVWLWESLI